MGTVVFLGQNQIKAMPEEFISWAKSSLPKDVHPQRLESFLLSRLALKDAVETQLGHSVPFKKLTLKNFHELDSIPNMHVSLSHTKDAAIAWVRPRAGFGIDLERLDREVKDHIWERILSKGDGPTFSRVELWCLKEAGFKTLYNQGLISGPIAFQEIDFNSDGTWRWKNIQGEYTLATELSQWQVAKTWINKV